MKRRDFLKLCGIGPWAITAPGLLMPVRVLAMPPIDNDFVLKNGLIIYNGHPGTVYQMKDFCLWLMRQPIQAKCTAENVIVTHEAVLDFGVIPHLVNGGFHGSSKMNHDGIYSMTRGRRGIYGYYSG